MASEDDLAILKEGVQAWNRWRRENPDIEPDLSFARLIGEDLEGVHFEGVNLWKANLREANLRGAKFEGANVSEAVLAGNRWVRITRKTTEEVAKTIRAFSGIMPNCYSQCQG